MTHSPRGSPRASGVATVPGGTGLPARAAILERARRRRLRRQRLSDFGDLAVHRSVSAIWFRTHAGTFRRPVSGQWVCADLELQCPMEQPRHRRT
jgi:hypothetical protein